MSIQGSINEATVNLVKDIAEKYKAKDHPHVEYTIVEFFNNYSVPWDSLNPQGREEFRASLDKKLAYGTRGEGGEASQALHDTFNNLFK